jgi:hypothetical protein
VAFPEIPRLTVVERRLDAWTMLAPVHHWVGEHHICMLALDDGLMAWARFMTLDRANSRAVVRPDDPAHLGRLQPGESCAFFDGFYGERVELVLGSPRHWFEVRYVPAEPTADGTPRVGTWVPAEAARRIGEGVSDHEHCSICSGKIGHGGAELGFASAEGDWLCLDCRREWLLPRSIGFALDWFGGARNPSPSVEP